MKRTAERDLALNQEIENDILLIKKGVLELYQSKVPHLDYFLPFFLIAAGVERLLKIILIVDYVQKNNAYPKANSVYKEGGEGHDLVKLLDKVINIWENSSSLMDRTATKEDFKYLKNDKSFRNLIKALGEFNTHLRYYNLNLITKETTNFYVSKKKLDTVFTKGIKKEKLVAQIDRFIRALSRMFTLGDFGEDGKRLSPHLFDFLFLLEEDLGTLKSIDKIK